MLQQFDPLACLNSPELASGDSCRLLPCILQLLCIVNGRAATAQQLVYTIPFYLNGPKAATEPINSSILCNTNSLHYVASFYPVTTLQLSNLTG